MGVISGICNYDIDCPHISFTKNCVKSWPGKIECSIIPENIKCIYFIGLSFFYFLLRWSKIPGFISMSFH